jgi:uncharacterized membrane protein HdeD (DUF308 family)
MKATAMKTMGDATAYTEFERRIEEQFGVRRGLLLTVGLASMALGAVSVALPLGLYQTLVRLIGVILLVSGAVKALQLLIGRRSAAERQRGWPVILCQVALDVLAGALLISRWGAAVGVAAFLLGLLFLLEGLLLLYMALRAPKVESGRLLIACGLVTAGIGLVIVLRLVEDPLRWAGVFVGLKLIVFGATLAWISLRALRSDGELVYEAAVPKPEVGELYAVYFGTAFHLGVFIGDGEVVHYLNDDHVYRVTWEQFLSGRVPEHWTYPDLDPVPPEVVVRTAHSEVGKTYPYNLLTFNCEHFALYCKTGGTSHGSRYAQIAGGVANVASHPFVGMVAEFNTRAVEWLAFHFGGSYGKNFSLTIRRVGNSVTNWLLLPARRAPD